jgi:pimeloyl-ACP methyl ester carboxylesterase
MTPDLTLAHDRSGPTDAPTLLLLHAGVADRRMWDPVWDRLTAAHDVVRVDLRGFGDSTTTPTDGWSHRADVLATLDALGLGRVHVVGASMGAGVAVEVALLRPAAVASLTLLAPGGSLIPDWTDDLRAFVDEENAALERGDLDAAAQANVDTWLVGPGRPADSVPEGLRRMVHAMQRRAFEITEPWPDVDEAELDPPALERLAEIAAPTLVLQGAHDLTAIADAADGVTAGVPGVRRIDWPDVAHLPSLERPDDVAALVEEWIGRSAQPS